MLLSLPEGSLMDTIDLEGPFIPAVALPHTFKYTLLCFMLELV
jgi:hypothetical protein